MPSQQLSSTPSTQLLRAAQYLRMSTEHQQYSTENQSAAIALYAAAHNIGIVRSFVDLGKTGTSIKHRRGLQELLKTVVSGDADFDLILVYDVSRWGRFPDADEAAHYEFLCKKAGVQVRYCAEQFENDNSTTSNLLKALKRTMAGEYSRELSVKIVDGQRRLAAMGYWQGGHPPYGMWRRIINQDGEFKEVLEFGQWKSVSTDRVVLTPGPKTEVETIQLAFDLFTKQRKTRHEIADILNQRRHFWGDTPWNIVKLRLLTNPVYKGAYPYCKHHLTRDLPPDKWLIRERAFPAIISENQCRRAEDRIAKEVKKPVDSEMLEGLRRLWKRKGTLNSALINAAKDIPSAPAYAKHFGGINEAYKLIGFPATRDVAFLHSISVTRKIRDAICEDICLKVRAIGGTAGRILVTPERIVINGNVSVKVNLTTGHVFWRGFTRWVLVLGKCFTTDFQIWGRLEPPHHEILDYFVIPALSRLHGALRPKRENNPPFLDLYRFQTLEPFINAFCSVPLAEEA